MKPAPIDIDDIWHTTGAFSLPCKAPFSFFHLIEAISKEAPSAEWVLHRIGNLLRKYERHNKACRLFCRLERIVGRLPEFAREDSQLSTA